MESQSAQFEREAEETRWRLAGTFEELRARMTPGRVVDQVVDYTRDGPAAEFLRNLKREAQENPMPLVLIGIGIAWLMLASSRTSRAAIASAADSVASAANDIGTATSAAVNRTSEWGQQTATRLPREQCREHREQQSRRSRGPREGAFRRRGREGPGSIGDGQTRAR